MDWTLTGVTRAIRGVYGRAVNKTTYTPTYAVDDPSPLVFDQATGRLLVDSTATFSGSTTTTTHASPQAFSEGATPSLQADLAGNLKVNVEAGTVTTQNIQTSRSTASWTSATSVNTALSLMVTNYSSALVTFNPSGTITAGVITFEVSDDGGTTWFGIQAARLNSFTADLTYNLSGLIQAWGIDIGGLTNFRIRLSTVITGSGTAVLGVQASSAVDPMPVVGLGAPLPAGTNTIGSTNPLVIYNTTPPTLTNGQTAQAQADSSGNLKVTLGVKLAGEDFTNDISKTVQQALPINTYSPSLSSNFGSTISAAAKASTGNVLSFVATNGNAAQRYFQIFNSASAPAGGATPIYSFLIPAGTASSPGAVVFDNSFFTQPGVNFSTGIAWGISSTAATYTAATATDHTSLLHYV